MICLITGATTGIGRATALALADLSFDLILFARNEERGQKLSRHLSSRHPGQRFEFVACDLSSLASVKQAASAVRSRWPSLDVLINNAGARFDTYSESVDGFELTFATNHLGHFLLTGRLMDMLEAAPQPRILTVASRRHRQAEPPGDWTVSRSGYHRWRAYDRSKLASVLFAFELARRLEGTVMTSNAIDPGIVASRFARNNGWAAWLKHLISGLRSRILVTPKHAARTVAWAASSPDLDGVNGRYLRDMQLAEASEQACSPVLASRLWELSVAWTGQDFAGPQRKAAGSCGSRFE